MALRVFFVSTGILGLLIGVGLFLVDSERSPIEDSGLAFHGAPCLQIKGQQNAQSTPKEH